jgi:hypothetical protein
MLTTESSSNYHDLEKMSVRDILTSINNVRSDRARMLSRDPFRRSKR